MAYSIGDTVDLYGYIAKFSGKAYYAVTKLTAFVPEDKIQLVVSGLDYWEKTWFYQKACQFIARVGIAARVDGIFLETHPNPEKALLDWATCWNWAV